MEGNDSCVRGDKWKPEPFPSMCWREAEELGVIKWSKKWREKRANDLSRETCLPARGLQSNTQTSSWGEGKPKTKHKCCPVLSKSTKTWASSKYGLSRIWLIHMYIHIYMHACIQTWSMVLLGLRLWAGMSKLQQTFPCFHQTGLWRRVRGRKSSESREKEGKGNKKRKLCVGIPCICTYACMY
jgi:hypothetical protein